MRRDVTRRDIAGPADAAIPFGFLKLVTAPIEPPPCTWCWAICGEAAGINNDLLPFTDTWCAQDTIPVGLACGARDV